MTESENRGDQTERNAPVLCPVCEKGYSPDEETHVPCGVYGISVPSDSTDVVPEDNEA